MNQGKMNQDYFQSYYYVELTPNSSEEESDEDVSSTARFTAINAPKTPQKANGTKRPHRLDYDDLTDGVTKGLQKTISGRITKARVSPRKTAKKDYKKLDSPYEEMNGDVDENGEKIFPAEKSESEDSFTSDQTYLQNAQAASIKMEEAI